MPSPLTHEHLREELRIFAREELRAELRELGDRVRRDVSTELTILQLDVQRRQSSDAATSAFGGRMEGARGLNLSGSSQTSDEEEVEELPRRDHQSFAIKHLRNFEVGKRLEADQAGHGRRKRKSALGMILSPSSPSSKDKSRNKDSQHRRSLDMSKTQSMEKKDSSHCTSSPASPLASPSSKRLSTGMQADDALYSKGFPEPSTAHPNVVQIWEPDILPSAVTTPAGDCRSLNARSHGNRFEPRELIESVSSRQSSEFVGVVPCTVPSPRQSWVAGAEPDRGISRVHARDSDESSIHVPSMDKLPPLEGEHRNAPKMNVQKTTLQLPMDLHQTISDEMTCSLRASRLSGRSRASTMLGPQYWYFHMIEAVIESVEFNYIMSALITANLIMVGVQTDRMARANTEVVSTDHLVAEVAFCAVFLIELLLRFYVYGWGFFIDSGWQWNVFDTMVVAMQVVQECLDAFVSVYHYLGNYNFTFMRALRILRVIRVIRAVQIVKHMRELQTIVLSIGGSLKSLCWTLLLLLLMIYVVAVYVTQVALVHRVGHPDLAHDSVFVAYYGSLGQSIFTLYSSIMGGIDWYIIVEPLVKEMSPVFGCIFSLYVAFMVLAMMNVITGVFVDASLKTARSHHETFLLTHASNLFMESDVDSSGTVSWQEFESKLGDPLMQEFFKSIDVDVSEARTVFHLLDVHEDGKLDLDQFMCGCLRLGGPAKAVDLAMLMHETRRVGRYLKQLTSLQNKVDKLQMCIAPSCISSRHSEDTSVHANMRAESTL